MKDARLDHVGLYVTDLDEALELYCGALGFERPVVEEKPDYEMRLARVRVGEVDLELIEAPVDRTMLRHLADPRPGPYHVGLRVPSADAELSRLKTSGVRALDDVPREGDGLRVAFLAPEEGGGLMVELVERLRR